MKLGSVNTCLTLLVAFAVIGCDVSDGETGSAEFAGAPHQGPAPQSQLGYAPNESSAESFDDGQSRGGDRREEIAAPDHSAAGAESSAAGVEASADAAGNEPNFAGEGDTADAPDEIESSPEALQWVQLSTDDSTSMASAQIFKSGGYYGRGLKVHEFLNYYDPPRALFADEAFSRSKSIDESIRFGIKADFQPIASEVATEQDDEYLTDDGAFEEDDNSPEAPNAPEDSEESLDSYLLPSPAPEVESVGELEILFQMQSDPIAKADRRNWNLFLCVDVSGSMNGEKIAFTIDALTKILPHLKTGDRLSLTTFNNEAHTHFANLEISENADQILNVFQTLQAQGGTNMTAGLRESYDLAQQHYDSEMLHRVILFGDGAANIGDTDIRTFTSLTRINGQEGIYLSGVGVGTGYDFQRMDQLTDAGKGAHIFLPNQEEVDIIFGDYFSKLVEVSADSIAIEATLPAGIELAGFSGEEVSFNPEQRLQNIVLAAGDDMTFTAKFRVTDETALDQAVALKVTLRPLSTGEEISTKIQVESLRELIEAPGRLFQRTRLVHRFGKFAANGEGNIESLREDLASYENPDWGIREIIELLHQF